MGKHESYGCFVDVKGNKTEEEKNEINQMMDTAYILARQQTETALMVAFEDFAKYIEREMKREGFSAEEILGELLKIFKKGVKL